MSRSSVVFALFALGLLLAGTPAFTRADAPAGGLGKKAPDFTLIDPRDQSREFGLDGGKVLSSSH